MTTRRANYVRERMYVCITTYLRNLLHLHYTVRPRECASSLHTNAPTRRPIDRLRYLDTGIAWIHFIISFQFRLSLPVTRRREITPPLFISNLLSRACLTLTEREHMLYRAIFGNKSILVLTCRREFLA